MDEKDIKAFANLLEDAGYADALYLIQRDLMPLAGQKHISLWDAAWEYANPEEDRDTSWSQLFYALLEIPTSSVEQLGIHEPL